MKKIILVLTFFVVSNLFSQNQKIISPPFFLNGNNLSASPIPLPTGSISNQPNMYEDAYDAEFKMQGSSNAVSDANGNLLFFVVDGVLYDNNGEFVDHVFKTTDNANSVPITGGYQVEINSTWKFIGPETIIVPVPGSCSLYYIFGSRVEQSFLKQLVEIPEDTIVDPPGPVFDSIPLIKSVPVYCLYDAINKTWIEKGSWYDDPL